MFQQDFGPASINLIIKLIIVQFYYSFNSKLHIYHLFAYFRCILKIFFITICSNLHVLITFEWQYVSGLQHDVKNETCLSLTVADTRPWTICSRRLKLLDSGFLCEPLSSKDVTLCCASTTVVTTGFQHD